MSGTGLPRARAMTSSRARGTANEHRRRQREKWSHELLSHRPARSPQLNTHNTEWRNVCYPWHPLFRRTVAVYEVFIKRGQSLCRCGLEEEGRGRTVEIPTWMLEPATCCRLRMMSVPTVSCDALLELKAYLRSTFHPAIDVVQAQHRPILAAGGADATDSPSTATFATHPVPSAAPASVASRVPARDSREDHPIAGHVAPRSRQLHGRRHRQRTGGA